LEKFFRRQSVVVRMKNSLHRHCVSLLPLSLLVSAFYFADPCRAEDNVWIGAASGNWEDASWSLGIVPATNQIIWITNAGWKAVQIGAATEQLFPQSLNVDAINISSPTNSFNSLLLNFAGAETPLTVKALMVGSNSAVVMNSSALQINGANGSGMVIGGKFDQNDSVVAGNQVNVGYVGPGVYNFNSGYFTVSQLFVGGDGNLAVFNQSGGTNGFGVTHLEGGTYVLSNGWYGATIDFDTFGTFRQHSGVLASDLTIFNGNYLLAGGIHQGWTVVPSPDGFAAGLATMLQTGGTNTGDLEIGSYGTGIYTMSNGVCNASGISVGPDGVYSQQDGTLEVSGAISISEQQDATGFSAGQFNVSGGQVSSSGLYLQGFYSQTGGTNLTAGDLIMNNIESSVTLAGGLLTANNFIVNAGWQGGVALTGGTLIITNDLSIGGINLPNWCGFNCGGQLSVSNIWVAPLGIFSCGNGAIAQSGILTLTNASLYSGSNCAQLGALRLATGGATNSTLYLVSPTSMISFNDSSSVAWSSEPRLIIEGWGSSLNGGGLQQVIFGNNSNGLTATQLAQIQFHNPAGLASGMYPARILANGEIVPAAAAPSVASMALQPQPGGMKVTLQGVAGRTYLIETSTDLVHWAPWTNQLNTTGTMTVTDTDATNYPARFYRAQLMP
jgi:hypothetical protein